MRIKAVLFDRDGTLTDFDRTWGPAISHVLRDLAGGDPEILRVLQDLAMFDVERACFTGPSVLKVQSPADYSTGWAEVIGESDPKAMLERIETTLLEHCARTVTPFDGVVDTLKTIHAGGLPMGIATNGTEASARKQMHALGLGQAFGFLAGYDSGHGSKPEPGQLLAFARHTGLAPQEIAMIGDSLHDMHAAKAAGMFRIAVTTGAIERPALEAEADVVIDTMAELLPLALGRAA
ncbi:HAD family hydrolase [Stappia sp.]|jgi:phosphoglycolate phosphatase|uniref:HAD family hydrolase n=1 Tax=Stappia sp. TaxID=1870903 RepID=UPI003D135CFE